MQLLASNLIVFVSFDSHFLEIVSNCKHCKMGFDRMVTMNADCRKKLLRQHVNAVAHSQFFVSIWQQTVGWMWWTAPKLHARTYLSFSIASAWMWVRMCACIRAHSVAICPYYPLEWMKWSAISSRLSVPIRSIEECTTLCKNANTAPNSPIANCARFSFISFGFMHSSLSFEFLQQKKKLIWIWSSQWCDVDICSP